ncbi:MAG: VOC family protein [Bacteroidota bacterium]
MRIEHIAIWTNNLEGLRDFYSKFLGCGISERYVNSEKHFSSYFLSFDGGARLEIMCRNDIEQRGECEMTGLAHFAVDAGSADKVDILTRKFENAGICVYSHPRTTGDGYYESIILDPDGNKVEITAPAIAEISRDHLSESGYNWS